MRIKSVAYLDKKGQGMQLCETLTDLLRICTSYQHIRGSKAKLLEEAKENLQELINIVADVIIGQCGI